MLSKHSLLCICINDAYVYRGERGGTYKEPSPFSFCLWVTTLRKSSTGDERWLQQRNLEVAYVLSLCKCDHHRTPVSRQKLILLHFLLLFVLP